MNFLELEAARRHTLKPSSTVIILKPLSIMTDHVNSASADAHMLVKALENIILPIVHAYVPGLEAFKSDGSGMELIERSTIFDRISLAMESDFYQADISSKLRLLTMDDDHTTARKNQSVIDKFISRHAKYAILSHTWLRDAPGEVTYTAWKAGEFYRGSAGYQKLASFCNTAATDHKITFGWMDTICINKDSSAELDESIRSMYAWYADASVCITYLAQTLALSHMRHDPWFTRGWTLQELLAPRSIKFYGANWQGLPTEIDDDGKHYLMEDEIFKATRIIPQRRHHFRGLHREIPISERMEWAANREVTREEDVAYSLMGIFDVSLSIAYGEGSERAFIRLLKEIMNLPGGGASGYDILNWGCARGPSRTVSSYIPSSPKQFLTRSRIDIYWPTPRIPFTLTHLGLQVSILLMPAISAHPHSPAWSAIGEFLARADVDLHNPIRYPDSDPFPRLYNILDATGYSCADSDGWHFENFGEPRRCGIIFGLLNFDEDEDTVSLPRHFNMFRASNGFALCFVMKDGKLQRIPTSAPVILDIETSGNYAVGRGHKVDKSKLGKHGIELRTIYLH